MSKQEYNPNPIGTDHVSLPPELLELVELLAKQAHERWAARRRSEGWTLGPTRDDALRTTPCMVPYADLPESEKAYDREMALSTLRLVIALGWRIVPPSK